MSKDRWATATGRVVGVRLPDSVYGKVKARADRRGMTVSEFCRIVIEREVIRSHRKRVGDFYLIKGKAGLT